MSEPKHEKILSRITTVLRTEKGKKGLIICGIAGILLIALPEFIPKKDTVKTTDTSAMEFVQQMEERLGEIVGSIEGAGECRIMVTLENGVEYVYATEQKNTSDRQEDTDENYNKTIQRDDNEETVIIIDSGDGREGLLVTEIQPTVKGVVVVCQGADREEVRERIVQAVTVALNISSKRVCVTKLS